MSSIYLSTIPVHNVLMQLLYTEKMYMSGTLANFQISVRGTNERKFLKRGTFLIFLSITTYRFLQKDGHVVKSFSFCLKKRKTGTVPPKEGQLASIM